MIKQFFYRRKIIFILTAVFLLVPFMSQAEGPQVPTSDMLAQTKIDKVDVGQDEQNIFQKALDKVKFLYDKGASKAFGSAMRNALNKIAYDSATYIGSGGRGQTPLFVKEDWGSYFANIADNAAGRIIEDISTGKYVEGGSPYRFNLCDPDLDLRLKIGLGLKVDYDPNKSGVSSRACTFSKMADNWERELQREDFLTDFQSMFDPVGSDLGVALSAHLEAGEEIAGKESDAKLETLAKEGWLDVRDISGNLLGTPNQAKSDKLMADGLMANNAVEYTGDAMVDAVNIFLNQLAITAFQNAMRGLADDTSNSSSPFDWTSLSYYEASPRSGGIKNTKERLSQIIEPKFSIRGDYNILSELTMCPDPNKAGPTNCVLTDRFKDAIINQLTVSEAMEKGYLNPDAVFGFTSTGIEPSYNEGFPYRSMLILRKFRIIPVGWELAAENIKAGLKKTYSLSDVVSCFSADDEYTTLSGPDCSTLVGLVDPNWVLKAPINYCRREGPGPEIVSEKIVGKGADSELIIARDDNYCADEQTCIDENDDGSCNVFGYCTEERRRWTFGSESCEPKYNTCQSFRASDGSKLSYLENTLDYSTCSIANAGCGEYFKESVNYDRFNDNVFWDTASESMYFDRDAKECDEDVEGCTEFIRTKAGIGANLISGSGFEGVGDLDKWGINAVESSEAFSGMYSMELDGDIEANIPVGPTGIHDFMGETFTLVFYAKNCGNNTVYGFGGDGGIINIASSTIVDSTDWIPNRLTRTYPYNPSIAGVRDTVNLFFELDSTLPDCLIDNIKLERGGQASRYSNYGTNGLEYIKIIPEYLQDNCYVDYDGGNYKMAGNAHQECFDYSRICTEEELGCDIYTSTTDKTQVPAKVLTKDYCPAECVGYDTYIQAETLFDSNSRKYFIPETAETCSLKEVGCDEFTNLDEIDGGGESREYYSYLKQCINPADTCQDFYTWEGSSDTGYQLRVSNLDQVGNEPRVTLIEGDDDSAYCSDDIYYLSSSDPAYNPDCREYYNDAGDVSYHLNSRVVTCSDNCHPYRRTMDNIVTYLDGSNITDEDDCTALGGNIDDANYCVRCENDGEWSDVHNACIYMAIPNEGRTCSASGAGCREYSGNTGNDVRIIFNNDFEGSTQGWVGEGGTNVIPEPVSLRVGGNSLFASRVAGDRATSIDVGSILNSGSDYTISFLAESNNSSFNLALVLATNTTDILTEIGEVELNINQWGYYELNIFNINHDIYSDEKIMLIGSDNFYIDDFRLTEIRDRYYLIRDSWQMPMDGDVSICDWDYTVDGPHPQYSLGCDRYQDSSKNIHHLKGFSHLCQDSAVGCEVMIDTQNSSDPGLTNYLGVDTPEDEYVYAVYKEKYLCDSDNKGCERMGRVYNYGSATSTQDFYLINNPDEYTTTLCGEPNVDCAEWSTSEGLTYFKDPGDQTCEWRQADRGNVFEEASYSVEANDYWGWYQKKVSTCGENYEDDSLDILFLNQYCSSALDCGMIEAITDSGLCKSAGGTFTNGVCYYSCIPDKTDYVCETSGNKTFGYGGEGKGIIQPLPDDNVYWAGSCPAKESGCTEYIDPTSEFMPNLIYNPDFSLADGWAGAGLVTQKIKLRPRTMYVFAAVNTTATLDDGAMVGFNDETNEIDISITEINIPTNTNVQSYRFFTGSATSDNTFLISSSESDPDNNPKIWLSKVAIDYQKRDGVNREECNGEVSFVDGCVLFNERKVNPGGVSSYEENIWSADEAFTANKPFSPSSAGNPNSNVILKVRPDRTCNEWLACKSYIFDKDNNSICYDIGLCDYLDDNNNCSNFITNRNRENLIHGPAGTLADASDKSGYVKIAEANSFSTWREEGGNHLDYFSFELMEQFGSIAEVTNGNFEESSTDGYPIGWSIFNSDEIWAKEKYKVINNPVEAEEEGIGNAPDGRGFLKLGPNYSLESGFIDIAPSSDYIFSAFANTLKVRDGSVRIEVYEFASDDSLTLDTTLVFLSGKGWSNTNANLHTTNNAKKIKILITTSPGLIGNFYIDNITLESALESRGSTYTSQDCRLYPDTDSLSCKYTEESGARKEGMYGYCLEYDRAPGNKDACIMWWPVDNVEGKSNLDMDNYGGYVGKTPVYHCALLDADMKLVEVRPRVIDLGTDKSTSWRGVLGAIASVVVQVIDFTTFVSTMGIIDDSIYELENVNRYESDSCPAMPNASFGGYYLDINTWTKKHTFTKTTYIQYLCKPDSPQIYYDGDTNLRWYEYNGNLVKFKFHDETKSGVMVYDYTSDSLIDPSSYNMKCSELVKTVTEDGQNKAWLGRVYSGSEYFANGLGYSYSEDDAPFGSMVIPDPVNNPYEWDASTKPGIQPIPFLPKESNKVRAGSPYDCGGDGCERLGRCNISNEVCYYTPKSNIRTADHTTYVECSPDVDENCYDIWDPTFLPCPEGEYCDMNKNNINKTTTADFALLDNEHKPTATANLERIFAKSYGSWTWQGDEGVCASNSAIDCTPRTNPCPGGDCASSCSAWMNGRLLETRSASTTVSFTNDTCNDSSECNDYFRYDETEILGTFNGNNSCLAQASVCGVGAIDCINENCCPIDGDTASMNAYFGVAGVSCSDYPDTCCTTEERASCVSYYQSLPAYICNTTLSPCNIANINDDCQVSTTCELDHCVGGKRDGVLCSSEQSCVGDTCVYADNGVGRYRPDSKYLWDVPTSTCPVTGRANAFNTGDYCAIPPEIENIKVNASSTYQIVRDGEIANLTFNSILDGDQEPLVRYSVLWDGELNSGATRFDYTTIAGVQINSKPESENPHSVFHLYEYRDLLSKSEISSVISCGDNITLDGVDYGDYCRVRPRVLVEDNWGWCTNGFTDHSCTGGIDNYEGADGDPAGVYIYVTLE